MIGANISEFVPTKSLSEFMAPALLPLLCELPSERFWLLVSRSGTKPAALRQIACTFGANTAMNCKSARSVSTRLCEESANRRVADPVDREHGELKDR